MNRLLIIPTLLLLPVITSCSSDNDKTEPELTLSENTVEISANGGEKTITVESATTWTASSNAVWCRVTPNGTTQLTITADKIDSEDQRNATVTVNNGYKHEAITVIQNAIIDAVKFDDKAFEKYCIDNFDTNKDGILSKKEAAAVVTIAANGLDIASVKGIEYFTSLQNIDLSNNKLTSFDPSIFTYLKKLNISNNQLAELNIRTNISLTALNCSNNSLLTQIFVWSSFEPNSNFIKDDSAKYVYPEFNIPEGYKLVWHDEFEQASPAVGKSALPNTTDWWYETGGHGWGNHEIQNYIPGVRGKDTCAYVSKGALKIVAKKIGTEVISVRMNSNQSWTYGYFEARLKLPKGKGTWPAFWMMPKNYASWPDDGEIDIMEEVGVNANYVSSSIHCKAYYHSIGTQKTNERYLAGAQDDFHIYALEWTEDNIRTFVDGQLLFSFDNDKTGNKNTWPFNTPFYLKLNLAWGGDWGGWNGVDNSALPCTYEIDYVRVFQK